MPAGPLVAADAARFAISTDGPWLRVLTQRDPLAAEAGCRFSRLVGCSALVRTRRFGW